MALYHKWDVKSGFAFVLQFFSLIFDGLGGVQGLIRRTGGRFVVWLIQAACSIHPYSQPTLSVNSVEKLRLAKFSQPFNLHP